MKKFSNILIFLSIFLICFDGIFALRINKLSVPKSVELECDYELEGDGLYAVKWYKGKREFYRYVPKETPVVKTFPVNGIKVNLEKSNDRIVSIEVLSELTAGVYSCEVSADAPSFATVIDEKELKLV